MTANGRSPGFCPTHTDQLMELVTDLRTTWSECPRCHHKVPHPDLVELAAELAKERP